MKVLAAFTPFELGYAMLQVRLEGSLMLKMILLLKLASKNSVLALSTVVRPLIWS